MMAWMRIGRVAATAFGLLAPGAAWAQTFAVSQADAVAGVALDLHIGGRTQTVGRRGQVFYRSQWPGAYFETDFSGREVSFRTGPGDIRLRVTVDGESVTLTRPQPGLHRVGPLADGDHRLRIDIISENQTRPIDFGGAYGTAAQTLRTRPRDRQIEFIGDSHTVGYANTSSQRNCAPGDVWRTTDTAAGVAGLVARRYDADYQVNAISGRGVVRNYDGAPLDTLVQAYPFVLLDRQTPYVDAEWRPQVIVVALGTNDFSTALKPGERWASREALTADYEAAYGGFLRNLARRDPSARILVWAIDGSETAKASFRVVGRLKLSGLDRIAFLPVSGLTLNACDWHPSLADDLKIADALTAVLDLSPDVWAP